MLARTLCGDAAACRALMTALAPVVQHRVARVLRRRRGAACPSRVLDLMQETFVMLLEDDARVLRAWRPAGGLSLENFVGLVAEREAISLLRSGRRSAWAECPTDEIWLHAALPADDRAQGAIADRELIGILLDRLQTALSPRGYAIFEALFLDERAPEDVMRTFGLSRTALYSVRSRARKLALELGGELRGSAPAVRQRPIARGGKVLT
jgi:DNA-directed RNA polymerase specialized sigma24 family protein